MRVLFFKEGRGGFVCCIFFSFFLLFSFALPPPPLFRSISLLEVLGWVDVTCLHVITCQVGNFCVAATDTLTRKQQQQQREREKRGKKHKSKIAVRAVVVMSDG